MAIKYISTYHGTYYVKGKLKELNAAGEVVETKIYENKDLSQNITRNVSSLSKKCDCKGRCSGLYGSQYGKCENDYATGPYGNRRDV